MQINLTLRSLTLGLYLIGLLLFAYQVMSPFLVPLCWAVILVYVTWPMYLRLKRLLRGGNTLSALLMTLLLTAVIVIPLVWMFFLLKAEFSVFYREFLPQWLETKPVLPGFAKRIPYLGTELETIIDQFDDLQTPIREHLLPWLQQFVGNLFGFIGDVGVMAMHLGIILLIAFFFYRDGLIIMRQVSTGMQLALGSRMESYIGTAKDTVKAVIYGIMLAAIAQATMAGLGYWAVGIRAPILLSAITMFFALIPFGAPLVWGSLSIWLIVNGEYWAGISLGAWGILVISWIDNIVRPLVIMGAARIPFLLVLFGVFGGLSGFGFIGLFLGPVVLAVGLAVWREWLEQHAPHPQRAE
ncbi:MAG: AI-2E family transporter [Gammaproteobacteria bacterium]